MAGAASPYRVLDVAEADTNVLKSLTRYAMWRCMKLLPGNPLFRLRAALWRSVGFDVHPTARVVNCARLLGGEIHIV